MLDFHDIQVGQRRDQQTARGWVKNVRWSLIRLAGWGIALLGLMLFADFASAQGSADWVDPATGILDDVLAGGIRIFQGIVILAVVGYCFSSLIQGRFDPMRALIIIISGAVGIGAAEIGGGLFGLT